MTAIEVYQKQLGSKKKRVSDRREGEIEGMYRVGVPQFDEILKKFFDDVLGLGPVG